MYNSLNRNNAGEIAAEIKRNVLPVLNTNKFNLHGGAFVGEASFSIDLPTLIKNVKKWALDAQKQHVPDDGLSYQLWERKGAGIYLVLSRIED